MAKINNQNNKESKHKAIIDKDKCKGCALCVVICPVKHLTLSSSLNKRGVTYAIINPDNDCIGCGFCFFMCPECCIEVRPEKDTKQAK